MKVAANQISQPLLNVNDLSVSYVGERSTVQAVSRLEFALHAGETLGIVGESGSGKTQTALALMGLLPETAQVGGNALFHDVDLLQQSQSELNAIRGSAISMIFQDPMTALNPHLTVGRQMARVLQCHQGLSRKAALNEAAQLLDAVRVPDARERLTQYPHEMSGGMRQRIMIATALLCKPELLIADEPTTALDVTVQAQILDLMRELQQELGTAILFITHDMGVVANLCDRVLVMRDGELRESGPVEQIFYSPEDQYTRDLLAAVPRLDVMQSQRLAVVAADTDATASNSAAAQVVAETESASIALGVPQPLLTADNISVVFPAGRTSWFGPKRELRAVDDVSFQLHAGETLGVVGESGCGKSTLARAVLQLLDNYAGQVCLLGNNLADLNATALKQQRQNMQVVFQDPLASLNPRMTVGDIVGEPLQTFQPKLSREQRLTEVQALLSKVGLQPEHAYRYPHEFSGGQCQRIGIARALITKPKLIVCDEPVSALDVSVQAQVINLLMDLQLEMGLALVFIAHDLAVVRHISHRVMVMYLGRVVEVASRDILYERPRHPYTQALISSVPIPDPQLERNRNRQLLQGDLPSPIDPPSGCAFRTRCSLADEQCAAARPLLRDIDGSQVACHHAS
jgi:peptide/nickel transport system ATP-binding protein